MKLEGADLLGGRGGGGGRGFGLRKQWAVEDSVPTAPAGRPEPQTFTPPTHNSNPPSSTNPERATASPLPCLSRPFPPLPPYLGS
jgi:hypothetical protein